MKIIVVEQREERERGGGGNTAESLINDTIVKIAISEVYYTRGEKERE